MLMVVPVVLAITLLSMKNQNWKRTYFKVVFAGLVIFGQILYFLGFAFYDSTHQGKMYVADNDLPGIGVVPFMTEMPAQYQVAWTGPYLSFPPYPVMTKSSIQNWVEEADLLTLLVGFGILISWGMVYGLLSRHHQLEHMLVELKQKEDNYKHALMDQKMVLLRTQIHPHFLSNSMSVIGAYILERTPIQAYQYLQDFSDLMRGILEKATEPFLSLQEEVHFLDHFLRNLSLLLPESKLSWHITVDPKLDKEETLIPTMILQPLVENAIEHGIRPKDGPGKVTISFTKEEGFLVCMVEDDGVGRFHSKRKASRPGHSSMAMAITEKRLQLITSERTPNYALKIHDLVDRKGEAVGTRVVVKLPLMTVGIAGVEAILEQDLR